MKKKILTTSPDWFRMAGMAVCGVGFLLMIYFEIDAKRPAMTPIDGVRITILGFILLTKRYILFHDYIVLCVLIFPIRKIRWTQIRSAIYIPELVNSGRGWHYESVLLSIEPIPFVSTPEEAYSFRKQHRFKCMTLTIPRKKRGIYFDMLEQCLGFSIDYHLMH